MGPRYKRLAGRGRWTAGRTGPRRRGGRRRTCLRLLLQTLNQIGTRRNGRPGGGLTSQRSRTRRPRRNRRAGREPRARCRTRRNGRSGNSRTPDAAPGATMCVGGCGDRTCGAGGVGVCAGLGVSTAGPGRTGRCGVPNGGRDGSAGSGCRGPLGVAPGSEEAVFGALCGSGRAGIEMLRLIGPAPDPWPGACASGGCMRASASQRRPQRVEFRNRSFRFHRSCLPCVGRGNLCLRGGSRRLRRGLLCLGVRSGRRCIRTQRRLNHFPGGVQRFACGRALGRAGDSAICAALFSRISDVGGSWTWPFDVSAPLGADYLSR